MIKKLSHGLKINQLQKVFQSLYYALQISGLISKAPPQYLSEIVDVQGGFIIKLLISLNNKEKCLQNKQKEPAKSKGKEPSVSHAEYVY